MSLSNQTAAQRAAIEFDLALTDARRMTAAAPGLPGADRLPLFHEPVSCMHCGGGIVVCRRYRIGDPLPRPAGATETGYRHVVGERDHGAYPGDEVNVRVRGD